MCINHNDKRIMRTCTLYNRIIDNLTSENKSLMLIKFTKVEVVFELMRCIVGKRQSQIYLQTTKYFEKSLINSLFSLSNHLYIFKDNGNASIIEIDHIARTVYADEIKLDLDDQMRASYKQSLRHQTLRH